MEVEEGTKKFEREEGDREEHGRKKVDCIQINLSHRGVLFPLLGGGAGVWKEKGHVRQANPGLCKYRGWCQTILLQQNLHLASPVHVAPDQLRIVRISGEMEEEDGERESAAL